jgi:hypothetical protein
VKVEVASVHGTKQRLVFYRVEDDAGGVTEYGPVITSDPAFDPVAHIPVVEGKMREGLAMAEFERVIGA